MKRHWNTIILLLTLVCTFLILDNTALADGVSLDQALTMIDEANEPILLNDDFSMYDLLSSDFYTHNEGKIIILYRVGPEKEFTVSYEPLADEYSGVDIGEAKVYLDVERMKLIPEQYRAKSTDEVGNIIMLESRFILSGQILQYTHDDDDEPTMQELKEIVRNDATSTESTDELPEKEEQHAYVYKPVFAGVTAVALYNAENGTSAAFDVKLFPEAELRDNPTAANIVEVIYALVDVYNACANGNVYSFKEAAEDLLEQTMLETAHKDELLVLFSDADYPTIRNKMVQLIWVYAEKICQVDRKHADEYRYVLEEQSLEGLFYLLKKYSYTAVTKSDKDIIRDKDYLGEIDMSTLDVMWSDVEEIMETLEWNPAWLKFFEE